MSKGRRGLVKNPAVKEMYNYKSAKASGFLLYFDGVTTEIN